MTDRDELADSLWRLAPSLYEMSECDSLAADLLADGWRKPRTITTAEELDALPFGAVVVDRSGIARTRRYSDSALPGGWTAGGLTPLRTDELADGHEMTVVWDPEENR